MSQALSHDCEQAPPRSTKPVLQAIPHEVPSHVGAPWAGTGQGAHAVRPQLATLALLAQSFAQR
jgi:hypothetical protein